VALEPRFSEANGDDAPILWQPGTPMDETFLRAAGVIPSEAIGQNFLVDPELVALVASQIIPNAQVVEIGAGPANMTAVIAPIVQEVVGLEIDPASYRPIHDAVLPQLGNARILYQDALSFKFEKWVESQRDAIYQVFGNIPFHIAEPLLVKLARLGDRVDRITLLVGDNFAQIMAIRDPQDIRYGRMSFVASLFQVDTVAQIPREGFWPVPRTDATLINLTPLEHDLDGRDLTLQLRGQIINQPDLTIIKVLNGFSPRQASGKMSKEQARRRDRRQTRDELRGLTRQLKPQDGYASGDNQSRVGISLVTRLGLPPEILSQPFSRLNNQQVRILAQAIEKL